MSGGLAVEVIGWLSVGNLVVAAYNVLPGLPLDGGRALRAAVWAATRDPHLGDRVAGWGGRLVAVACVGGDGQPLMPCGRCRQLLWEHGGADMLIETVSLGIVPMREVLPDAFGPEDLVKAAAR